MELAVEKFVEWLAGVVINYEGKAREQKDGKGQVKVVLLGHS